MFINDVVFVVLEKLNYLVEWLGVQATGWDGEVMNNFLIFNSIGKGEKGKKKVSHLVWFITALCIWLERNSILFNGKVANCLEVHLIGTKQHSF